MFHFLLVANNLGKVYFKENYDTSRLRFSFLFINGPFRCLAQGCRFK